MSWGMLAYIHVRRDLVEADAPLRAILDDINRIVEERQAIILADGQFLRVPISEDWGLETYFSEETSAEIDHQLRDWGAAQRAYFGRLWGITQPYQYGENPHPYERFCISARIPGPYLAEGENILALVNAEQDGRYLYCTCHSAAVVYTSHCRLVCMSCGALHCVLSKPIATDVENGLTESDWNAVVADDGEFLNENIPIRIIDYRSVKAIPLIWTTDTWRETSGLIDFYATATREDIERYETTLPSAADLVRAGFKRIPTVPPLAVQVADDGFGVDIVENAVAAINSGAQAYAESQTNTLALRNAVLNLFQAIELILKIRLEQVDGQAAGRRFNNPTVLRLLAAADVVVPIEDLRTIDNLRTLRNQLQHDGLTSSYRKVRALLRRGLVLVDQFVIDQFGWWIGEIVQQPGWGALLKLEPVRLNAERQAASKVERVRPTPGSVIERCAKCFKETLVRIPGHGPECCHCGGKPTLGG